MGHQARAAPDRILGRSAKGSRGSRAPCSSAPLTPASSALIRYSASASARGEAAAGRRRRRRGGRARSAAAPAGAPRRAPAGALGQDPLADHQVAEQPPLVGQPDLGAVGELAGAAEVVDDRGGQQQVGVQPRVQLAQLVRERRDRDRVLEQPAEVRVVAGPRARRPPPRRPQRRVRRAATSSSAR